MTHKVYNQTTLHHPVFNQQAIQAQAKLLSIQGQRNTWFCGAWTRYGFHEDGLLSSVNVAKSMGATIPWQ
jgi:predicted NAD/FAD-binding protein